MLLNQTNKIPNVEITNWLKLSNKDMLKDQSWWSRNDLLPLAVLLFVYCACALVLLWRWRWRWAGVDIQTGSGVEGCWAVLCGIVRYCDSWRAHCVGRGGIVCWQEGAERSSGGMGQEGAVLGWTFSPGSRNPRRALLFWRETRRRAAESSVQIPEWVPEFNLDSNIHYNFFSI